MMKVKSTREVHIRSGEAGRKSHNLKGVLYPGFEIEVEEVSGEVIDKNGKWYKDKNGDFLWSGGFGEKEAHKPSDISLDESIDYRTRISLSKTFDFRPNSTLGGSPVEVAVLDSGIMFQHPDFKIDSFVPNKTFANPKEDPNYIDSYGHGTKVTGIIGGRNSDRIGVTGVCPDCKIQSIKTLDDDGYSSSSRSRTALETLESSTAVLANLSFDLPTNAYSKVSDVFTRLSAKCILIASAGDDEILGSRVSHPASNTGIISVASISFEKLTDPDIKLPDGLNYIVPRMNFITTLNDELKLYDKECRGSSFATALVTGLAAEIISQDNSINTTPDVIRALDAKAFSLIEFRSTYDSIKRLGFDIPVIKCK